MLKKMARGMLTLAVIFVMAAGVYALDSTVPAQTSAATYTVKNLKLYKNGKRNKSYTGWLKLGKKIYYITNGKAAKGWKYAWSYGGGKDVYKYYFEKDGSLRTNFFAKNYNKWIKANMRIEVNLTTHTVTFLAWDSTTKTYRIPLKACICATSRNKNGTPTGYHRLEKTSAKRWYIYDSGSALYYYQWAVHIKGTPILFHSCRYSSKSSKRLVTKLYNKLGGNITTHCIRLQAVNAKLIYDIATKTYKKARVKTRVYRSNTKGAFGQVKLKDTTGKIKTKYDPTDPKYTKNSYKIFNY